MALFYSGFYKFLKASALSADAITEDVILSDMTLELKARPLTVLCG